MDFRSAGAAGTAKFSLGLAIIALVLTGQPARAGYCGGDKARVKLTFERWGHELHLVAEDARQALRHLGLTTRFVAGELALWDLQWQSRQLVDRSLGEGREASPDALEKSLRPLWQHAVEIRSSLGGQAGDAGPAVSEAVNTVLAAEIGCHAIRAGDPEACQALLELSPDLFEGCQRDAMMLGLLWAHRCETNLVQQTASLMKVSADALLTYCRVLAGSDPAACTSVPGLPASEVPTCRALVSLDADACVALPEDPRGPERIDSCRKRLRRYRIVQGAWSGWPDFKQPSLAILERSHLVSGRDRSRSCADVALSVHDLLSARFFDLDSLIGLPVPRLR